MIKVLKICLKTSHADFKGSSFAQKIPFSVSLSHPTQKKVNKYNSSPLVKERKNCVCKHIKLR
jgi:hypothetical protein